MATKIRLKRMGKKFYAVYRVVIMDSRNKRDGKAIEEIGLYNPNTQPSTIEIDSERAQYWLGVGAQPTDQVRNLLKITGDWQKFKGLKGAEGTLKTVAAKPDAATLIEEADTKAQTPFIATALLKEFGSSVPIALYLMAAAIISFIALLYTRETKGIDLRSLDHEDKVRRGVATAS